MRANAGASAAAGGLQYQYLVILERLLDVLDASPCSDQCVHVDSSPAGTMSDDEIVDYAIVDEAGRPLSLVQVKSVLASEASHRRRLDAPAVATVLCRLVAAGDAAHYALVTNAALTAPGHGIVAALGDPEATGPKLRARLAELCAGSPSAERALAALQAHELDRLRRCELVLDARTPEQVRADLAARLRTWRMTRRVHVAHAAAELLTGYLVSEIFQRAVPHGRRTVTLSDLRQLLLTDPAALTLAAGARDGTPLGGAPWVPDVERSEPLARLVSIMRPLHIPKRVTTCAITGLSGLGKTSLAAAYAHAHAAAYDVVVWLDAESADSLRASVEAVLGQMRAETDVDGEQPLEQRLPSMLAAHPGSWLVVFDGAQDFESLSPWLPRNGAGHVLITSTNSASWSQLHRVPLGPMSEPEALALLQLRLATTCERPAVEHLLLLARELEHWPLALELAAAYIVSTGISVEAIPAYLDVLRARAQADETLALASYPRTLVSAIALCVDRIRDGADPTNGLDLHRLAVAVLDVAAYLGSRAIPLQLALACALIPPAEKRRLSVGAGEIFGPDLAPEEVLRVLLTQSLVAPDRARVSEGPTTPTFSMNEIVQSVLRSWHDDDLAVSVLLDRISFHVQDWLVGFIEARAFEELALVEPHAGALVRHLERDGPPSPYGLLVLGNLASAYRSRGWATEAIELLTRELAYVDRLGLAVPELRMKIHTELAVLRLRVVAPDCEVIDELETAIACLEAGTPGSDDVAVERTIENLLTVCHMLQSRGAQDPRLARLRVRLDPQRAMGNRWNSATEQFEIQRLIADGELDVALGRVADALTRPGLLHEQRMCFLGLQVECLSWLHRWDEADVALRRLTALTGDTGHLAEAVAEQALNVALAASTAIFTGEADGFPLARDALVAARTLLALTPEPEPVSIARLAVNSAFVAAYAADAPAVHAELSRFRRADLDRYPSASQLPYAFMDAAAHAWLDAQQSSDAAPLGGGSFQLLPAG